MGTCVKRVTSPSVKELRERSEKAYTEQEAYKAQLIEAYKGGKLKSKRLIAEAEVYVGGNKND